MSVHLRPYQEEGHKLVFEALKKHRKVILVLPTGAGKNTVASYWAWLGQQQGRRIWFVVNGNELVTSFIDRAYEQFGVKTGLIQGNAAYKDLPVQTCSMATLCKRDFPSPDLIIVDECHGAANNSYKTIFDKHPNCKVIGITATPFRADGKPLSDIFDYIVHPKGSRMRKLIQMGCLVPFEFTRGHNFISSEGLSIKGSGDNREYDDQEVYERLTERVTPDSIVDEYLEKYNGKVALIYSVNIARSKEVHEAFVRRGIKAAHINGMMNHKKEVQPIIDGTNQLKNMVICANNKGIQGMDIPPCELVVLDRVILSYGRYLQCCGRGGRPYTFSDGRVKEKCTILDIGQNLIEHGYPEDYDLVDFNIKNGSKKKGDKEFTKKAKFCPECDKAMKPADKCCECGFCFPTKERIVPHLNATFQLIEEEDAIFERISRIKSQNAKDLKKYLTPGTILIYTILKGKRGMDISIANAVHIYADHFDPGYLDAITEEAERVLTDNKEKFIKKQKMNVGKTLLRLAAIEEGREELVDKVIAAYNDNIG